LGGRLWLDLRAPLNKIERERTRVGEKDSRSEVVIEKALDRNEERREEALRKGMDE
jgi:hypothetical protein